MALDASASAASLPKAKLKALESDAAKYTTEYNGLRRLVEETAEQLVALKDEQRTAWKQQARLTSLIQDLKAQGPVDDARTTQLRAQLDEEEQALTDARAEWTAKRKQFAKVLSSARSRISELSDQICTEFNKLAQQFLEEDCTLNYQMKRRRIGQAGTLMEYPSFVVQMSSAGTQTQVARISAAQVSESQKEYLDLAFRMAVMRTAAESKASVMLVIETPEASLDSHFVMRAGSMLRQFTYEAKNRRHTVLASSNLNKENMIPALLGLYETGRKSTPKTEVKQRVINLLQLAARPKSLVRHYAAYERQLTEALVGG